MSRTAVVIYNLGGPDSPEAVRPFLKNLFSDPMILRVPAPVRWFLSWFIAWRRAPVARGIYARIGGRSPILPETEKQAAALQAVLGDGYKVFIAMRYWHPFADEAARDVAAWGPKRVILLPLYPQGQSLNSAEHKVPAGPVPVSGVFFTISARLAIKAASAFTVAARA